MMKEGRDLAKNKLISVVIPMYFEELIVEECYNRICKVMKNIGYNYEIIFVNDGSRDKTQDLLEAIAEKDNKVKVISFSRNFGHQIAVTAGIDYAKGNAIVIMDADMQDPPELVPEMIAKWEKGFDVVYAKRLRRRGETPFKLLTAKLFYRLLDFLTDIRIPLDSGDFRLIDRKIADVITAMREKNRFLRGMVAWAGFNQGAIEYERHERFAGVTKYPLKKMLKLALDGIFSFSAKPLKYVEYLGAFSILISFYMLLTSIIKKLFHIGYQVDGWTSLMVTICFIGGIQLIGIGVVGEYVGRIYDESKNRPLYVVHKVIHKGAAELEVLNASNM